MRRLLQAKIDAAWGAVERGVKYVVIASGYKPNTYRTPFGCWESIPCNLYHTQTVGVQNPEADGGGDDRDLVHQANRGRGRLGCCPDRNYIAGPTSQPFAGKLFWRQAM